MAKHHYTLQSPDFKRIKDKLTDLKRRSSRWQFLIMNIQECPNFI